MRRSAVWFIDTDEGSMKIHWTEFKEFAVRGNVVEIAVGIILGTAFSKLITSLISDIIMPPVGMLLGNVDFSNLYVNLSGGTYATLAEAKAAGAITIAYGTFINSVRYFFADEFFNWIICWVLDVISVECVAAFRFYNARVYDIELEMFKYGCDD